MNSSRRSVVDHLGFTLEGQKDCSAYEDSQAKYLRILAKRAQRWENFLKLGEYKYRTDKLRRFIRKGIPNEHRPMMWMRTSGAKVLMKANPNVYENLLQADVPAEVSEHIDIDIPRTFCNNFYYQDNPGSLRPALRRILHCLAIRCPKIGYCQGVNYVAALILLVLRDEQKAFWLLYTVTNTLLPDYYVGSPTPMLGSRADLYVLNDLVKEHLPRVGEMMDANDIHCNVTCTRWLLCIFIDVLPTETVLRIWDVFLNEGRKVLFRASLLLILKSEVNLMSCTASHHVIQTFQQLHKDQYVWYSHTFLQMLWSDIGELSSQHLDELTTKCRQQVLDDEKATHKTRNS